MVRRPASPPTHSRTLAVVHTGALCAWCVHISHSPALVYISLAWVFERSFLYVRGKLDFAGLLYKREGNVCARFVRKWLLHTKWIQTLDMVVQ